MPESQTLSASVFDSTNIDAEVLLSQRSQKHEKSSRKSEISCLPQERLDSTLFVRMEGCSE